MSRDSFTYRGAPVSYTTPDPNEALRRIEQVNAITQRAQRSLRPNRDEVSVAELARDTAPLFGIDANEFAQNHPVLAEAADQARYSPAALGMSAVPFSDELMAAYESSEDDVRRAFGQSVPDVSYGDAANRWSEYRADQEALNPGSAAVGMLAQGIATAPFLPGTASTGGASAFRTALRAIPRLAAEGAVLGGVQALDRSEHRPIAEIMQGPPATGDNATTLDRAESYLNQALSVGGTALNLGADTLRGARNGAALNVAIGAPLAGIGQAFANRINAGNVNAARQAMDRAIETSAPIDESLFDDAIAQMAAERNNVPLPGIVDDIAPASGAANVEQAIGRERPGMMRRALDGIADAATEGLDPDLERVRAAGLLDRAQIRGVQNTMGIEGLSRRMDRYGILPEGEIAATPTIIDRARRVREIAGDALGKLSANMDGEYIDADIVASRIDDLAAQHRAIGDVDEQAIADGLERQAAQIRDTYRVGEIVDPNTGEFERLAMVSYRDLQDLINGQRGRNASVYQGSITGNIPAARRGGLEAYRAINAARDQMLGDLRGPEFQSGARLARDVYHTASMIAPAGRVPNAQLTAPTLSRRILGSAGAGIGAQIGGTAGPVGGVIGMGVGGLVGIGAGSQMRNYEHAVIAALMAPNRGSLAESGSDIVRQLGGIVMRGQNAPQTTQALRELMRVSGDSDAMRTGLQNIAAIAAREGVPEAAQIAEQAVATESARLAMPTIIDRIAQRVSSDPAFGGSLQPILEGAARRGTLLAVLSTMARRDPDLVVRLATEAAPDVMQAQPSTTYQGDPWVPSETPDAPDDVPTYEGDPWTTPDEDQPAARR